MSLAAGEGSSIGAARALNMQIRRIADMLPGGHEPEYGFSCECGCGGIVGLSAPEFDAAGGAWADGHRIPPAAD